MWTVAVAGRSASENCRKVTLVNNVRFDPFASVMTKRGGLESESDQLRVRRCLLGEVNRFDVHIAESNSSARDTSPGGQGPGDRQLQDFVEEGVELGRVVRPDHDVVDLQDRH